MSVSIQRAKRQRTLFYQMEGRTLRDDPRSRVRGEHGGQSGGGQRSVRLACSITNHQTFTVNATIFVARELAASLFQAGDSFVCMCSAFAFEDFQVRQASASEIELGVADALHHALIQVRLFVFTTDERHVLRAAKIATTFRIGTRECFDYFSLCRNHDGCDRQSHKFNHPDTNKSKGLDVGGNRTTKERQTCQRSFARERERESVCVLCDADTERARNIRGREGKGRRKQKL